MLRPSTLRQPPTAAPSAASSASLASSHRDRRSSVKPKPSIAPSFRPLPRLASIATSAAAVPPRSSRPSPQPPPPPPTLLSRPNPKLAAVSVPRQPLRPRDRNQNAPVIVLTTRPPKFASTAMPAADRQRLPPLGAAASRSINRAPLTPKVATIKPSPSSASSPAAGFASRRSQTNALQTPPTLQTVKDSAVTPASASASALASDNVTPRSGSRQNRVDSLASAPLALSTPNTAPRSSPVLASPNGPRHDASSPPSPPAPSDSSKFFYASDAKTLHQSTLQRPASVPQKPAAFFYANGTPDLARPRPPLPASASASSLSSNPKLTPIRPSVGPIPPPAPRQLSPLKASSTLSTPVARTNPASPSSPIRTTTSTSSPPLPFNTSAATSATTRRLSTDAYTKGLVTSASTPVIEPPAAPRPSLSPISPDGLASVARGPGHVVFCPSFPSMVSTTQSAEDTMLREEREEGEGDALSEAQSSTKSMDAVSELVANARRERKVQDLEITNASLEAINRTLERQLRKQTAELRRYRRLSRSGRLSLAIAASSRVPSGSLPDGAVHLSALDTVDDDWDDEEEDEDEDFLSDDDDESDSRDQSELSGNESTSAGNTSSPDAKTSARRKRDERRLRLDLKKHQELLVDSQKMNQSLKRCLNWTEVLIKEGQKALAYNVRVSDIRLGGRVLAPSDDEDDEDEASPGHETSMVESVAEAV